MSAELKRTIRIKISANGRGLASEAMELTLRPLDDSRAIGLYKRLCDAVNVTLKTPFPPI